MTMNDLEHARTGTSAVGRPPARALGGGDRRRRAAAAPKFGVVDVIAQHDEEPHEELAGNGDPRLRAAAAVAQVRLRSTSSRAAWGAAWPRTQRSSELPCLVIWPNRYLSADALRLGAMPT